MNYWMPMPTKKLSEPKNQLVYFLPAIAWGIIILVMCLMPGRDVPSFLHNFNDKLIHTSIYFLAGILIYLGFVRFNIQNNMPWISIVWTILICAVLGGVIEILQYYFISKRDGDWFDELANCTGCILSVLGMRFLQTLIPA